MVPGQKGRATDALCWVGPRLFSAGLNGEITEYDLDTLRPKYSVSAYGGPIWSVSSNPQGTLLAVSREPKPQGAPGAQTPGGLIMLSSVSCFRWAVRTAPSRCLKSWSRGFSFRGTWTGRRVGDGQDPGPPPGSEELVQMFVVTHLYFCPPPSRSDYFSVLAFVWRPDCGRNDGYDPDLRCQHR